MPRESQCDYFFYPANHPQEWMKDSVLVRCGRTKGHEGYHWPVPVGLDVPARNPMDEFSGPWSSPGISEDTSHEACPFVYIGEFGWHTPLNCAKNKGHDGPHWSIPAGLDVPLRAATVPPGCCTLPFGHLGGCVLQSANAEKDLSTKDSQEERLRKIELLSIEIVNVLNQLIAKIN